MGVLMLAKVLEEEGEFELKYTFPDLLSAAVEGWLAITCKKDETYPESRVQSIYLETADKKSYQEKVNSDFFKTKFRVRWYETKDGEPYAGASQAPVFLEKKMKIGSKRLKRRWTASIDFNELKDNNLSSTFHGNWYRIFAEHTQVASYLQPFIQISYTRKRFVDKRTGTRLSLDSNIRIEKTNSQLLPPPPRMALGTGVFEIKSKNNDPPAALAFLTSNVVSKARFSKYERCVSSLGI